jgi:hypothetical protein
MSIISLQARTENGFCSACFSESGNSSLTFEMLGEGVYV